MLEQTAFLEKYPSCSDSFARATEAGLTWETLQALHDDYILIHAALEPTGNDVVSRLRRLDAVHSLRFRVKDPEHLVEKVIRKQADAPADPITVDNYRQVITDLVGVRALHLFKDEWRSIHEFIRETWSLHEKPVANVREGDPDEIIQMYESAGCEVRKRNIGYRSVHYVVQSQPTKAITLVEIQVRTLFEEGWSEIDHRVRYPYHVDDPLLTHFLLVFNRLVGSADEMASFLRFLQRYMEEQQQIVDASQAEYIRRIEDLETKIQHSQMKTEEKEAAVAGLESLSAQLTSGQREKANRVAHYLQEYYRQTMLFPEWFRASDSDVVDEIRLRKLLRERISPDVKETDEGKGNPALSEDEHENDS
jgi:ppGpp synthetase/RelA/SpoT-type nucleotidyltranferase